MVGNKGRIHPNSLASQRSMSSLSASDPSEGLRSDRSTSAASVASTERTLPTAPGAPAPEPVPPAKRPPPAPLRDIELLRVTFVQLKGVDCVEQTFKAHLMVECRIAQGALDPDLMIQSDEFPKPSAVDGSFRPSALWYLNKQFDYPNALEFNVLESKTFAVGDDLHLVQRVDGTFNEIMNLANFPFDTQQLNVELMVKCAAEGPMPAALSVGRDVLAATEHFSQPNLWDLHGDVGLSLHEVGPKNAQGVRMKTYPALQISVLLSRRPAYYVINIAMPMAIFSLMGALVFMVPRDDVASRLQVSLTLVVTAATYKFAISSMMPAIAYLTLLDKYIISTSLLIALVVFENGLAGALLTDASDWLWLHAVVISWLVMHGYFVCEWYWVVHRRAVTHGDDGDVSSSAQHTREVGLRQSLGRLTRYAAVGLLAAVLWVLLPQIGQNMHKDAVQELRTQRTKCMWKLCIDSTTRSR
jgi:hypothetical protein